MDEIKALMTYMDDFPDINIDPGLKKVIDRTHDIMLKHRKDIAQRERTELREKKLVGMARCPVCQDFMQKRDMIEAWWRVNRNLLCPTCYNRLEKINENKMRQG